MCGYSSYLKPSSTGPFTSNSYYSRGSSGYTWHHTHPYYPVNIKPLEHKQAQLPKQSFTNVE